MAELPGATDQAPPLPVVESGAVTPVPHHTLSITTTLLRRGTVLHRVHDRHYNADQFNPGIRGNARFSPIQNAQGEPIPTLYGGATRDCALMETAFHDVPFAPGFKTLDKHKLNDLVHSTVELTLDMELIDLASVALRKLGVSRKQLIETEKDRYPATRQWAAELHRQCPKAQGLCWISRQDDSARAVVLFGDRIAPHALRPVGESLALVDDGGTYDSVLDLALRLGVLIVQSQD